MFCVLKEFNSIRCDGGCDSDVYHSQQIDCAMVALVPGTSSGSTTSIRHGIPLLC